MTFFKQHNVNAVGLSLVKLEKKYEPHLSLEANNTSGIKNPGTSKSYEQQG